MAVDHLYPTGENRPERLLIEYQGIMHSEAEEVFYGLSGVPKHDSVPFKRYFELREKDSPYDIYEEINFFRPKTLLKYLNYGAEIPNNIAESILQLCKYRYTFRPSTLTSFAGALVQLIQVDYIKGVTFIFNNEDCVKDLRYLNDIVGEKALNDKCDFIPCKDERTMKLAMLEILEEAQKEDNPYTTVVTNQYDIVKDALTDYERYGTESTFFLLKNNSDNCDLKFENGKLVMIEKGNKDIEKIIYPQKDRLIAGLPLPLSAKFARFNNDHYLRNTGGSLL